MASDEIKTDAAIQEWTAVGARAAEHARLAPWREGDWLVAGLNGGKLEGGAKAEAIRVTGGEGVELTRLVAVCRAFPPETRRPDLSFDHHAAVVTLEDAAERSAMLDQALANGWTARRTRQAVTARRVELGAYFPPTDDDPEDKPYRAIVQAWNRASRRVRQMFLESAEETGLAEIIL